MTVTIPHDLPRPEAESRVKGLISNVKQQFGDKVQDIQEEWQGDTGRFKFSMSGHSVGGTIQLLEKAVEVNLNLPFIATFFKGKIQSVIEQEGARLLT